MESSHALGLSHGIGDELAYQKRIDAINYALAHDDGATTTNYGIADVILVGVSRTGKTPTSLYLAMQYGIHAANYPLTPDDFGDTRLPEPLAPYRDKLYGLTINPERLARIRNERKPGSRYASLENCRGNRISQCNHEQRRVARPGHHHEICRGDRDFNPARYGVDGADTAIAAAVSQAAGRGGDSCRGSWPGTSPDRHA